MIRPITFAASVVAAAALTYIANEYLHRPRVTIQPATFELVAASQADFTAQPVMAIDEFIPNARQLAQSHYAAMAQLIQGGFDPKNPTIPAQHGLTEILGAMEVLQRPIRINIKDVETGLQRASETLPKIAMAALDIRALTSSPAEAARAQRYKATFEKYDGDPELTAYMAFAPTVPDQLAQVAILYFEALQRSLVSHL